MWRQKLFVDVGYREPYKIPYALHSISILGVCFISLESKVQKVQPLRQGKSLGLMLGKPGLHNKTKQVLSKWGIN